MSESHGIVVRMVALLVLPALFIAETAVAGVPTPTVEAPSIRISVSEARTAHRAV
jgi:hypothetical protein